MGDRGYEAPDGGSVGVPGSAGDPPDDVLPVAAVSAFALLDRALAELGELRLAPLAAGEVRAVARARAAREASLSALGLSALAAIDDRDDVVPKARAGSASVLFQERALGQAAGRSLADSATAHLLDPDRGDLPRTGSAFRAGAVSRGHVDVITRAHRRLGAPGPST